MCRAETFCTHEHVSDSSTCIMTFLSRKCTDIIVLYYQLISTFVHLEYVTNVLFIQEDEIEGKSDL